MPPTPPFIVLDVPLEVENAKGELVPVTVETLRGNSILHGVGVPSNAEGQEGDFYLETLHAWLYGPKGATTWPGSPVELGSNIGIEAVTTEKLHSEAVTEAKLATGSVTNAKLAANSVTASKIAAEAVETAALKAGAVTAPKLGAEAVETAALKNGAVTAAKLGAEAVEAGAIKAGAVTAAKLAGEAVETAAIKALAVTEAKLAAGAVTAAKLGAEAVEAAAIKAGAVTASKLGAEAVEEAAIKAEAVTAGKIATGAVTAAKLGAESVETAKIKGEAVTEAKLVSSIRKKKFREGHTFVLQGAVATGTIPPFYVPIVAGQEGKLVAVRYSIQSGTNAKFRLTRNGAEAAGFGSAGTPLTATGTATTTEPTAISLSNGDAIGLIVASVEGAPVGLAITVYVETIC